MIKKGRTALVAVAATALCGALAQMAPGQGAQDRVSASEKGSVLIFSKIELRWDHEGKLIQDTFVDITNDFPEDVNVLMYFVNGDPPLPAVPGERAHPGWNWVNVGIFLTMNEPTYWSAATGEPKGVSPFTILDPGDPPGRPDPEGTGDRVLRGFIVAVAVNASHHHLNWNHLKGDVTIVNYMQSSAWEYNTFAFQAVSGAHGSVLGTDGILNFNGAEYSWSYDLLLLDFYAVGAASFSGGWPLNVLTINTDLTLHPVSADFRQETEGPVRTKAHFDIWNMNEVKFSGTFRCIECWDQRLLSSYGVPNHFLLGNLQTSKGKARIDGLPSQLCPLSEAASLLGVAAKYINFNAGASYAHAGTNLVGMGTQAAEIRFDPQSPPPPAQDPEEFLDYWIDEINVQLGDG